METEEPSVQEWQSGVRWPWFVGGCALSITTLCSLALFVLLLVSTSINAYLAWTMAGYEMSISRRPAVSTVTVVITPASELALAPTQAPTQTPLPTPTPSAMPSATPALAATLSTLQSQYATLAAIATQVAAQPAASTPAFTPVAAQPNTAEAPSPSNAEPAQEAASQPADSQAPEAPADSEAASASADNQATEAPADSGAPSAQAASQAEEPPAATRQAASISSANTYSLIPIEGGRETRPAAEHGDLNLKLRDPQPANLDNALVDIPNAGSDPNAPHLSSVLKPDFVATYAVHDWDWNCNCKGKLIEDGKSVLVGVRTTPGQPLFIPRVSADIFQGKYYATLLYASEDSLTFVYSRRGNVARGYTIHYVGLQTDPNLLALFRQSKGNELPGLSLDVPVGVASDQLVVAIRDNGTFMDARSRADWWK